MRCKVHLKRFRRKKVIIIKKMIIKKPVIKLFKVVFNVVEYAFVYL